MKLHSGRYTGGGMLLRCHEALSHSIRQCSTEHYTLRPSGVINHGPGTPGGLAPLPNSPGRLVGQDPTPLPFASWPRYGELTDALPAARALLYDLDFWGFSKWVGCGCNLFTCRA